MKIAEGVAKALEYLHNQKLPPIIYGGLKTTGILLDENYNPKLSDSNCVNHVARSGYTGEHEKLAYGYIATELFFSSRVSFKTDVYSFGVVLVELISGRKAIDRTRTSGEICMALWARRLLRSKKFKEIADPLMKGQYPYRGLVQALGLVKMCIHRKFIKRPPIAEVVTTLSKIASQIYEEERGTTEAGVQRNLVNLLHQPCCRTQVVVE
ncbi:probable serine/threonine-protein kinase PBL7 [Papaver somniferum]|nr:probable serine/threonine-protein kinase PBL7 [Papaver somniferum]